MTRRTKLRARVPARGTTRLVALAHRGHEQERGASARRAARSSYLGQARQPGRVLHRSVQGTRGVPAPTRGAHPSQDRRSRDRRSDRRDRRRGTDDRRTAPRGAARPRRRKAHVAHVDVAQGRVEVGRLEDVQITSSISSRRRSASRTANQRAATRSSCSGVRTVASRSPPSARTGVGAAPARTRSSGGAGPDGRDVPGDEPSIVVGAAIVAQP